MAISFALILLVSNMGFAMAVHYCGGLAVESQLMVGHYPLDCGMPDMDMEDEPIKDIQLNPQDCCDNQYQFLDVDDDFLSAHLSLSFNVDLFITFIHTWLNVVLLSEADKPQYASYSPPLLLRDIPVLHQVFLI